ncbi:unnamed protein product [Protopolystoma xenopodis]|uniref:Secreted protein n=1 Tax=Protopolystoma xenopodis TaxID=117903 RepID=A0A3S5ANH5_9PLAT|nr:unnamed protein product [Protopolystoma xenopodis]
MHCHLALLLRLFQFTSASPETSSPPQEQADKWQWPSASFCRGQAGPQSTDAKEDKRSTASVTRSRKFGSGLHQCHKHLHEHCSGVTEKWEDRTPSSEHLSWPRKYFSATAI